MRSRVKLNLGPRKLAQLQARLARGLRKIKRPTRTIYVVYRGMPNAAGEQIMRAFASEYGAWKYAQAEQFSREFRGLGVAPVYLEDQ